MAVKRRRLAGKQSVTAAPGPEHFWGEGLSAAAMGISCRTYQRLKLLGCPRELFSLLVLHTMVAGVATEHLIRLEMFCGVAAISRAFSAAGLAATGYDYLKDPRMNDITTPEGFICALAMVMSLHPTDGFLWLATVCSSWVWLSRGSTGRSVSFPLGVPCASVDLANLMVARCALLILLVIAMGCAWGLEQPATSLMTLHPAMEWLRRLAGLLMNSEWYEVSTPMGAFNAPTVKMSKLYGNRRLVLALARKKACSMGVIFHGS